MKKLPLLEYKSNTLYLKIIVVTVVKFVTVVTDVTLVTVVTVVKKEEEKNQIFSSFSQNTLFHQTMILTQIKIKQIKL